MTARSRAHRALAIGAPLCMTLLLLAVPIGAQAPAAGPARPLSLEEALALATGTSESLGIARAGVDRARGQQMQARSALLPQVNTSLNYQRQLQNQFQAITERFARGNDGGTGGPPADSASGGDGFTDSPIARIFASPYTATFTVQASQSVFDGGRALAGTRAARAQRNAADLAVTSAGAQVQLDVTQAYYDAVLADRLVAIAESSFVQSERTLRQVQLTYQVGNTSEFELLRARVTRDNQRPPVLQARTQRTSAYLRLKQLLDLPLTQELSLTSPIVEAPVEMVESPAAPVTSIAVDAADALAADPRVRGAVASVVAAADTAVGDRLAVKQVEQTLEATRQQFNAAKASRWPSLSVSTLYQRFAYPDDGIPRSLADFFPNWSVSAGLSFPLFTGGRLRGDVMAAEAAYDESRYRLAQAREAAALEARLQVEQLEAAQAAWLASVGTAAVAQRAYEIAEVRFREGLSTQVELSESRVQWQQALANRAQAARDLQVAQVRLALLRDLPLAGAAPQATTQAARPSTQGTTSRPAGGAAGTNTQPGAPGGGTP
jgi:outer membrane protein TolC